MSFQEYLIQNQNTTFKDFIENAFYHFEKTWNLTIELILGPSKTYVLLLT